MLHQVGDLFELNVKLRCQKVNVCIVLLNVSSVSEQYKKTADLSETSVNIIRHFDALQNTSVFNISVNIGVFLLSV